jgi:hypothetical protein
MLSNSFSQIKHRKTDLFSVEQELAKEPGRVDRMKSDIFFTGGYEPSSGASSRGGVKNRAAVRSQVFEVEVTPHRRHFNGSQLRSDIFHTQVFSLDFSLKHSPYEQPPKNEQSSSTRNAPAHPSTTSSEKPLTLTIITRNLLDIRVERAADNPHNGKVVKSGCEVKIYNLFCTIYNVLQNKIYFLESLLSMMRLLITHKLNILKPWWYFCSRV